MPSFHEALLRGAADTGFSLTEDQVNDFTLLVQDLLEWNQRMNLTAVRDPVDIVIKHILDSMTCFAAAEFPKGANVLDVGTGAGFPGLVISILRRDARVTLLDSTRKKLSFVEHILDHLQLQGSRALFGRAEELARTESEREAYDVVLARAVAPMRILCELCLPFVRPGGVFLAMKGPNLVDEMRHAAQTITVLGGQAAAPVQFSLPYEGGARVIIPITKTAPTPAGYPRLYRDIRRQPL